MWISRQVTLFYLLHTYPGDTSEGYSHSCSRCLQTNNACGWCIYNKVCSGTPAPCTNETNWYQVSLLWIPDFTCPAFLKRTESLRVWDSMQYIHLCTHYDMNIVFSYTQLNGTNTTYVDVCPLLEPSSTPTRDYVQPVGVDRDIQLQTRNLPAPVSAIYWTFIQYSQPFCMSLDFIS